jgi:hypothetical protein
MAPLSISAAAIKFAMVVQSLKTDCIQLNSISFLMSHHPLEAGKAMLQADEWIHKTFH